MQNDGGAIYVLPDGGHLTEVRQRDYLTEADLQTLLADYPNLLAGDQMNAEPRQWILVRREAGLAAAVDQGDRWSLDHLFIDQDGVPTVVEVKRGSDTRIRREVVGQMLDYAANAVVYLPVDRIRSWFEERCVSIGSDPADALRESFGPDVDPEVYWSSVGRNLLAGQVRLVFVADSVPPELRRIVEFLNGQMSPAEVLAVEVPQFIGAGMRVLVPRVIGRTATADRKPPTAARRTPWTQTRFFEDLAERRTPAEVATAREIHDWAVAKPMRIAWGIGEQTGSFAPVIDRFGVAHSFLLVYSGGSVVIPFGYMKNRAPFDSEELRREFARHLATAGWQVDDAALTKWPSVRLSRLAEPGALQSLLAAIDWAIAQLPPSGP